MGYLWTQWIWPFNLRTSKATLTLTHSKVHTNPPKVLLPWRVASFILVQTCHFSSKTTGSLAPLKSLSLFGLTPLTLLPSKVISSFSIHLTLFHLFILLLLLPLLINFLNLNFSLSWMLVKVFKNASRTQ